MTSTSSKILADWEGLLVDMPDCAPSDSESGSSSMKPQNGVRSCFLHRMLAVYGFAAAAATRRSVESSGSQSECSRASTSVWPANPLGALPTTAYTIKACTDLAVNISNWIPAGLSVVGI